MKNCHTWLSSKIVAAYLQMGIKSFFGRAIGGFGHVLKRVGDFGVAATRKVAEFAPGVASAGAGIADMLGQGGIAAAIRKGGEAVARYSPQVESILGKVGGVGETMRGIGRLIT